MSTLGGRLQAFYGTSQEATPATTPSSMDSTSYVPNLISSGSLHELLSAATTLDAEVQQLNESGQTLIYDNYSEFLAAAETIHTLNIKDRDDLLLERVVGDAWNVYEPLQVSARKLQVSISIFGIFYNWDIIWDIS